MSLPDKSTSEISPLIREFLDKYQAFLAEKAPSETIPKIHVDEISSAIASFYEKIRNVVAYREEHLLRKGAIERVFKRRLFVRGDNQNFAELLIQDIIRVGHLPNDTIPETKIKETQKIIDKYVFLMDRAKESSRSNRREIIDWLIKIGTCEIEEKLDPPFKDNNLAALMYQILHERLVIQRGQISDEIKNTQLFINIQRALLRVDDSQLDYRLLKFLNPSWMELNPETFPQIADKLFFYKKEIKRHLKNPLGPLFFQLCNQYNTIFYLISDIISNSRNNEEMNVAFEKSELFEKTIKNNYNKRYETERGKLTRLAFLSVVSFFITKVVVAFGLEIPLDKYIVDQFSWLNVMISIIAPPLLMLIIVLTIRMPSEKNLKLVIEESKAVVYGDKAKNYALKLPIKKSWFGLAIVQMFSLIMFFITFGALTKLLLTFHFSIASIVIFLFFISLVAATGTKAYNRSRELSLEKERGSVATFLIDLFAMPLIAVGKWGASALSKFNFIILIFDLLIEVPLQIFFIFLENLRGFIKSQKDELY